MFLLKKSNSKMSLLKKNEQQDVPTQEIQDPEDPTTLEIEHLKKHQKSHRKFSYKHLFKSQVSSLPLYLTPAKS